MVSDDEPRPAIAAIYSKLRDEPSLSAGGTIKRVDISPVGVIPKVIFYEDIHSNLPLRHRVKYNMARQSDEAAQDFQTGPGK